LGHFFVAVFKYDNQAEKLFAGTVFLFDGLNYRDTYMSKGNRNRGRCLMALTESKEEMEERKINDEIGKITGIQDEERAITTVDIIDSPCCPDSQAGLNSLGEGICFDCGADFFQPPPPPENLESDISFRECLGQLLADFPFE
jgi:hypothetical protein